MHLRAKNKNRFEPRSKGFTLVELLVSISIMVIIMSVVLINYHRFDNTFSVSNLAYDVALSIRQAQSYGISVHANTTAGVTGEAEYQAEYQFGYGIHFSGGDDNHYILFADSSSNGTQNYYDGDASCSASGTECLQRYTLTSGYIIKGVCTYTTTAADCTPIGANGSVDIVFRRPDPDAIICPYTDASNPNSFLGTGSCVAADSYTAVITIASPDASVATSTITVQPTGQISVN